jgi:hypothetical protein
MIILQRQQDPRINFTWKFMLILAELMNSSNYLNGHVLEAISTDDDVEIHAAFSKVVFESRYMTSEDNDLPAGGLCG